jgi:hypothetical protein
MFRKKEIGAQQRVVKALLVRNWLFTGAILAQKLVL